MAKCKYKPEFHIPKMIDLLKRGARDKDIYTAFGISDDTFYRWLREFSDFSGAYKENKQRYIISKLERTAFKISTGYTIDEPEWETTQIEGAPDASAQGGIIPIKVVTKITEGKKKYIPPDGRVLMFMLANLTKNRKPGEGTVYTGISNTNINIDESTNVNFNLLEQIIKTAENDQVLSFGNNGNSGKVKKFKHPGEDKVEELGEEDG